MILATDAEIEDDVLMTSHKPNTKAQTESIIVYYIHTVFTGLLYLFSATIFSCKTETENECKTVTQPRTSHCKTVCKV